MKTGILTILIGVLAVPFCSAETIRLTTGEVLIGEVKSASFDEVSLDVIFPSEREVVISAKEIAPATLYELMAARDSDQDASAKIELAEYCLKNGLYAHAVVEARKAARLDEEKKKEAKEIESVAWQSIASSLLDEGKTRIAIDQPSAARVYLQAVVSRYPDTKAAKEARKLLKSLPSIEKASAPARVTDSKKKDILRAKLAKARKFVERAEKRTGGTEKHFHSGKGDEYRLRRAESDLRKADALLQVATKNPTDDTTLDESLREFATSTRGKLAKIYLELGSLYLGRGSIKLAEDYCSKACEIEPGSRDLHRLHERIIDARIALRFGTT